MLGGEGRAIKEFDLSSYLFSEKLRDEDVAKAQFYFQTKNMSDIFGFFQRQHLVDLI